MIEKLKQGLENFSKSKEQLETEIGEHHYVVMKIQPIEFIHYNNFNFLEGECIKRIALYKVNKKLEDLQKAIDSLQLLKELDNGKHTA